MSAAATSTRRRFARVRGVVVEKPIGPRPKPARHLEHLREPGSVALDPEGLWRSPWPDCSEDPVPLRLMGARARADLLAAVAEWTGACPNPTIRQGGAMILRALADHLNGEPIGRALGLEPPAGLIARREIDLARRDALILRARDAVPAWRDAPARQAAKAMLATFERYHTGAWQRDRRRDTAPAAEPAASFWRLIRLNEERPMPGTPEGLALIIHGPT